MGASGGGAHDDRLVAQLDRSTTARPGMAWSSGSGAIPSSEATCAIGLGADDEAEPPSESCGFCRKAFMSSEQIDGTDATDAFGFAPAPPPEIARGRPPSPGPVKKLSSIESTAAARSSALGSAESTRSELIDESDAIARLRLWRSATSSDCESRGLSERCATRSSACGTANSGCPPALAALASCDDCDCSAVPCDAIEPGTPALDDDASWSHTSLKTRFDAERSRDASLDGTAAASDASRLRPGAALSSSRSSPSGLKSEPCDWSGERLPRSDAPGIISPESEIMATARTPRARRRGGE